MQSSNNRSMTRRFSLSLPEDVGEVLDREPIASAYVAEAVRQRHKREKLFQTMAKHGYLITEKGMSRAGKRLADKQRQIAEATEAGRGAA